MRSFETPTRCFQPFVARIIPVLLLLTLAVASPAQTYKVVANTSGIGSPYAPFVQALNGNLYGTTNATQGTYGYGGSVIQMTPAGKTTTIYQFCSLPNCADGQAVVGIVLGRDGNIYGLTELGGANSSINCSGEVSQTCGTVFKLTPTGKLTTLYSFCSQANCADGSLPGVYGSPGLIQGSDGNFYGYTTHGGNNPGCPNDGLQPLGCGTLFKITPTGTLTTLYSFCSQGACSDGAFPSGTPVQGRNGSLYGTALYGGTGFGGTQCGSQGLGCGIIFEVTLQGVLSTLYNFCIPTGCTDGSHPGSGLVLASSGVFYGTANDGGQYDDGTIFSLNAANKYASLYSFCAVSGCPDGSSPMGIIQTSDGDLYGTTGSNGANASGTLFKITPAGGLTTLYSFCAEEDCNDGGPPSSPLFQSTNGIIYGFANSGPTGNGVAYSWSSPQLHRFVDTLPTSGKAGTKVTILGNNLTGATAITFNGTAATYTVVSASEITTTVPTGATTGKVTVTTSTGTKLSTLGTFSVP